METFGKKFGVLQTLIQFLLGISYRLTCHVECLLKFGFTEYEEVLKTLAVVVVYIRIKNSLSEIYSIKLTFSNAIFLYDSPFRR